ncbi:Hypothetical predicted protein [Lecanosticta acicola]|uniref:Mesaconyl-C4 CoA hydratase n=1 Tax=Lecanosticta acicola TaxID=111012 RepID=A0AAI8YVY7_9PEZI|nr:Hypothetical predicted protein [Lecanosticta acicola]
MATISRNLRFQWLKRTTRVATRRRASTLAEIQNGLPKRLIAPTWDDLFPQNSYRLQVTLADHLPEISAPAPPQILPPPSSNRQLPIGHHLVYFEQSRRGSSMLPDGTNPDQSPGKPFVRRMWAGGRVRYSQHNPLQLDGGRGVGCEFIRNVDVRGKEGAERIFVRVERRLAKATPDEVQRLEAASEDESGSLKKELEHRVRQRLWRNEEEDFGQCSILETRNLVFMKERSPEEASQEAKRAKEKILKPQHSPDYTHVVVPDAKLLFRFSALTFNAHSIHLDRHFAQNVEGHANLLLHGPLSYTFLVTLLQQQLSQRGNEVIKTIEYRNLAPLYCDEPVTFGGKQVGERKWDVWAQGPEGGVAVKGSVVTETGSIDRANLGQ